MAIPSVGATLQNSMYGGTISGHTMGLIWDMASHAKHPSVLQNPTRSCSHTIIALVPVPLTLFHGCDETGGRDKPDGTVQMSTTWIF